MTNDELLLIQRRKVKTLEYELRIATDALKRYASSDSWVRTSHCNESHWDDQIGLEQHPSTVATLALTTIEAARKANGDR